MATKTKERLELGPGQIGTRCSGVEIKKQIGIDLQELVARLGEEVVYKVAMMGAQGQLHTALSHQMTKHGGEGGAALLALNDWQPNLGRVPVDPLVKLFEGKSDEEKQRALAALQAKYGNGSV